MSMMKEKGLSLLLVLSLLLSCVPMGAAALDETSGDARAAASTSQRTLGDMDVGSTVKLRENGVPTDYIVVQQGLPSMMYDGSCDGTWLLRKEIVEQFRNWHSEDINEYSSSAIHQYLNNTVLSRFNTDIQRAIRQIKIPYATKGYDNTVINGAGGLSSKVFLLSGYEIGWTTGNNQYLPPDGSILTYFKETYGTATNDKRIALFDATAASWYLRSPRTSSQDGIWSVSSVGGTLQRDSFSNVDGVRPALIMPRNLLVDANGNVTATTIPQTLAEKPVGSIVTLEEDGVPTPYIIVNQGNPDPALYDASCDGTWLLRKEILETRQWHGSNANDYAASTIKAYLDSTFLNRFDANIRNAIKQVKIPYRPGRGTSMSVSSGTNGLSCKIFLLSDYEMGWTNSDYQYFPPDGAKLAYFEASAGTSANNKRIAYLNGGAASWWLRSPSTDGSARAWLVHSNGGYSSNGCSASYGVRPALVLPSSLLVSDDGSVLTNTAPGTPSAISVPGSISGGTTIPVSWAAATDADGNLAGYTVERSTDGGATWSQIFKGNALTTSNWVAVGTPTVIYRVKAYDAQGLTSGYRTSGVVTVTNTASYKVEHHQQNVSGSGYTQVETVPMSGTIEDAVTAQAKTYTGFTESATHPDRVASGTIQPDGSLVLRLYYDRTLHSVTFDSQGGTSVSVQNSIRWGGMATLPTAPTKTGYNFGGWFHGASPYSFATPITTSLTLVAQWTARGDTAYRVAHYQQNVVGAEYTLHSTDTLSGTTDAPVTAAVKTYTGFTQNATHPDRVASGSIAPDGSLVLRLYYDREVYSATFHSGGGSTVPEQTGIRYGGLITQPVAPAKQGYDFGGWYTDATLTTAYDFAAPVTGNVDLYAAWTARTDTSYRVEHYQQDVTGPGYTLFVTTDHTGTTDTTATAVAQTYVGFTENATHPDRVASGSIAPDGSLVLRLYYDREVYSATFHSGGGGIVPEQTGIRYGGLITQPVAPAKQGYDFGGWYTDSALTAAYDFAAPVAGDVDLYAAWTARSDTPYRIEHHQQDVTGAGYPRFETTDHTGTTDTTATAVAQSYLGFAENSTHPDRVASGSIAPDGSLVLRLYYDREVYSATFHSGGGSTVPEQSGIRYGGLITQPVAPAKQGYDFGGWYTDATLTTAYDFAAPVTGNVDLYAAWTARTDTSYRVEHYQQDVTGPGYTLFVTTDHTGTTDTTATAVSQSYLGFTENATHPNRVASGSIAPDGSLVLRLYYDREVYSATFHSGGGSTVPEQTGIRYGGLITQPVAPTKQGYDFGGWYTDSALTAAYDFAAPMAGDVDLYAAWTARTDTSYRVEHHQQDVTGAGYTRFETTDHTGTTDTTATAVAQSYLGFAENSTHPDRVASGSIAPDGSLVLRLYYDREVYSATFHSGGGSTVPEQTGIRYGGLITQPVAPTKQGYDFGGWYTDSALTVAYDFATPVAGDVDLYAAWTARTDTPYRVEHYQQDVTGAGYTRFETTDHTGTTDTTATAVAQSYLGFAENSTHPDRAASGSIAPDGSLVLRLYYDRMTFTVSFDGNGGSAVPEQTGIFGKVYGPLSTPTRQDHTFVGWYTAPDGGNKIAADTPLTTAQDHTLFAQWSRDAHGILDGTVTDSSGQPVAGAKITIRAGNTDYKTSITNERGEFTIADVKLGMYNLVAERDGIIVTKKFQILAGRVTEGLVLPQGKTNSVVEVGSGAPDVVVGGLNDLFQAPEIYTGSDAELVAQGGTVELRMTVAPVVAVDVPQEAGRLDLDITAQKACIPLVGEPATQALTELPTPVEVFIPYDPQAGTVQLHREHAGQTLELTTTPNEDGEYYVLQDGLIVVHAKKFSIYTIQQSPESAPSYRIQTMAGVGGRITQGPLNVSAGDTVDITITPDPGHSVAYLLVDGQRVAAAEGYRFSNVGRDHTIRAEFSCPSAQFRDVELAAWYHTYVDVALQDGLMVGMGDGTFGPNAPLTRAQMVTIIAAAMDAAPMPVRAAPFRDVALDTWYAPYVAWAKETGISVGVGADLFAPEAAITRQEFVVMLHAMTDGQGTAPAEYSFPDLKDVAPWAANAMSWALNAKLLMGYEDGTLRPKGLLTRGEAATIFQAFLER